MNEGYKKLEEGLENPIIVDKTPAEIIHEMMTRFVGAQIESIRNQETRAETIWRVLDEKKDTLTNRELIDLYAIISRQKNANIAVLLENFKTEERQSLLDPAVLPDDRMDDFYASLSPDQRAVLEKVWQLVSHK